MLYAQVLVLTAGCHLVSRRKITRSSSQLIWIPEEDLYEIEGKRDYSTDAILLAKRKIEGNHS